MTVPTHITSTLLIFLLLCSALLATTLQGVQGEVEVEGPSESECRPYIEKALKQLEIGDTPTDRSEEALKSDEDTENKSEGSIEKTEVHDLTSVEENIPEDTSKGTDSVEIENENEDDGTNEQNDTKEADESGDDTQSNEDATVSAEAKSEEQDDKQVSTEDQTQESEGDNRASSENVEDKSAEQEGSVEEASEQISGEHASDEDKTVSTEEGALSAEDVASTDTASAEGDTQEADATEEAASVEVKESVEETSPAEETESKEQDDTKEETSVEVSAEETGTSKETAEKEDSEEKTVETSAETSKATDTEEVHDEADKSDEKSAEKTESTETDDSEKEEKDASKEDEKSAESEATATSIEDTDDSKATKAEDSDADEVADSAVTPSADSGADETTDSGATDSAAEETEGSDAAETGESEETKTESAEAEAAETVESEAAASTEAKSKGSVEEKIEESTEKDTEASTEATGEKSAEEDTEASAETKTETGSAETEEATESVEAKEVSEETAETESEETPSEEKEITPEEELIEEIEIPTNLRSRDHINEILQLNEESTEVDNLINKAADITLRELKRLYENAIKPLEVLYKYRDLSNRHFGDSEIFSKPLVLFMGPWSGGKSSIINYLLDNEYTHTSLRTGAEPSPAYFNIMMWGEEPEVLDGTQMAPDFTFSGLQKFGQGLEERLRGHKLPSKLLEKINIVEIPGILEVRKQVSRMFPFNDACQWFIDRADIIFLVYDPSKLDVGPETEAILDQLKGREYQTRIILNKADQVKPEELMRVQGALIWNISPLMSSAQPPVMYTTSLWSRPYEPTAPTRLLQAQEKAFLRDLKTAIDKRIENKIASARRFAVRVRNHAKMVDCYLTTYYNHKSVFGNKKLIADQIIEHPQDYHIYEGLSTLTNISRYDLPDPDVYRDFFRLNPLYDFQQLSATCTYFRGCPINRLDMAIAYDLPELVGKYKKMVESALSSAPDSQAKS